MKREDSMFWGARIDLLIDNFIKSRRALKKFSQFDSHYLWCPLCLKAHISRVRQYRLIALLAISLECLTDIGFNLSNRFLDRYRYKYAGGSFWQAGSAFWLLTIDFAWNLNFFRTNYVLYVGAF